MPPPFPNTPEFASDFVLFPASSPPPARKQTELAPAISSTPRDQATTAAFTSAQDQSRRPSQSAPSPFQNPRVRNSLQGSITSLPSSRSNSSGTQPQSRTLYSNSAPTSSMTLQQQSQVQRPPIPLFPKSANLVHGPPNMESDYSLEVDTATSLFDASNTHLHSFDQSRDFAIFDPSASAHNMSSVDSVELSDASKPLTVSPKDLMNDMSAPPSAVTTDFSTPISGLYDSPGMAFSTETSPMFNGGDELGDDSEQWTSLFPNEDGNNEISHPSETPAAIPASTLAPLMQRSESSPSQHGRHPSINSVRSRRREKTLPVIDYFNESDPTIRKRKKNTEAARKSRAKKQERVEAMQERIDELEAEVAHYKARVARLESDYAGAHSMSFSAEP